MGDGHLNKCKECTKADAARQYYLNLTNPGWIIKERERQRKKEARRRELGLTKTYEKKPQQRNQAHIAVNNAVRDGRLSRQPCEVCGELEVEGHHEDYDRHLDVVWLCVRHHHDRHIYLRNCKTLNKEPIHITDFINHLRTFNEDDESVIY